MIERFRKTFFPNLCISFTLVMLLLSINEILVKKGQQVSVIYVFCIELFIGLIAGSLLILLIENLNIKKASTYVMVSLAINYAVFLPMAFLRWVKFSLYNLIWVVVIITALYLNIYFHTRKQVKREAEMINKLIAKRNC